MRVWRTDDLVDAIVILVGVVLLVVGGVGVVAANVGLLSEAGASHVSALAARYVRAVLDEELAREAFGLASAKLPFDTSFVKRTVM